MAMQAYLKIEGIGVGKTESTIEVLSFQWGVGRSITAGAGGGGVGKANIKEITITKRTDSASPQLYAACVSGEHLGTAVISILLPAVQSSIGDEFLIYQFSDIALSQFETGGNFGGAALPVETLKFEFGQVAILLPAVQ